MFSGYVLLDGEPVVSAEVVYWLVARTPSSNQRVLTTTDAEGYYEFTGDRAPEDPGDYVIELVSVPVDPTWTARRVVTFTGQSHKIHFQKDNVWILLEEARPPDTRKRVRVSKNPLFITRGHQIVWKAGQVSQNGETIPLDAPFTIHFPSRSPLTYRRLMTAEARIPLAEPPDPITGNVWSHIPTGKYSYFVAVLDPETGQIITEDPEIIDENGDDPGGGGGY